MEVLTILVTLLLIVSLVNLALGIALAGSMVKMVRSLNERGRASVPRISRQRRYLDVEGRTPTYADIGMLNAPEPEGVTDRPTNWDGLPRGNGRNWDGLPKDDE